MKSKQDITPNMRVKERIKASFSLNNPAHAGFATFYAIITIAVFVNFMIEYKMKYALFI